LKVVKDGLEIHVVVEKLERKDDTFLVQFRWQPEHLTFSDILEFTGHIPLPPYLNREDQEDDAVRYQTMFARNDGSVAAPTAGLHFTPEVLGTLAVKNIEVARITLHVGAGTFRPVNSETLEGHQMHREEVSIHSDVIKKLLEYEGKPVILVGTTTVRAIESVYWQGVKWLMKESDQPVMNVEQWDPYKMKEYHPVTHKESLTNVIDVLQRYQLNELRGKTSLMIAPGYRYQFPDAIITNFHQPKSTLLLLVSAFIGDDWRKAYDYALDQDFRFLSYGDSCLFMK
jgi:S-adenosylmethionine:tRNA ribosyltransferase-isomerase